MSVEFKQTVPLRSVLLDLNPADGNKKYIFSGFLLEISLDDVDQRIKSQLQSGSQFLWEYIRLKKSERKKTSSVLTMQQILPVGPVSDNSFPEPQIIALKGLTTFLK